MALRFMDTASKAERERMTLEVNGAVGDVKQEITRMVRHMFGEQGIRTLRDEYPAAMYAEIYNVMSALVDKAYFDGRMHVHVPKEGDE